MVRKFAVSFKWRQKEAKLADYQTHQAALQDRIADAEQRYQKAVGSKGLPSVEDLQSLATDAKDLARKGAKWSGPQAGAGVFLDSTPLNVGEDILMEIHHFRAEKEQVKLKIETAQKELEPVSDDLTIAYADWTIAKERYEACQTRKGSERPHNDSPADTTRS